MPVTSETFLLDAHPGDPRAAKTILILGFPLTYDVVRVTFPFNT
jgi:hypothetical protein